MALFSISSTHNWQHLAIPFFPHCHPHHPAELFGWGIKQNLINWLMESTIRTKTCLLRYGDLPTTIIIRNTITHCYTQHNNSQQSMITVYKTYNILFLDGKQMNIYLQWNFIRPFLELLHLECTVTLCQLILELISFHGQRRCAIYFHSLRRTHSQ